MASIIFLHGASSAGKTSIAIALQKALDSPFLRLSSDQLVESGVLPEVDRTRRDTAFAYVKVRPRFFDGFHRCIQAFADAGNDLIVDHIVETRAWLDDCVRLLAGHEVFYVGVRCELTELERREQVRGDRQPGEARSHVVDDHVYDFSGYDFEVNTARASSEECARAIQAEYARHFAAGSGGAVAGVFARLRMR